MTLYDKIYFFEHSPNAKIYLDWVLATVDVLGISKYFSLKLGCIGASQPSLNCKLRQVNLVDPHPRGTGKERGCNQSPLGSSKYKDFGHTICISWTFNKECALTASQLADALDADAALLAVSESILLFAFPMSCWLTSIRLMAFRLRREVTKSVMSDCNKGKKCQYDKQSSKQTNLPLPLKRIFLWSPVTQKIHSKLF